MESFYSRFGKYYEILEATENPVSAKYVLRR